MPDIGDLKHRAATAVPAGWLLCDGRAVSRATYAALFGVIGTAWGAGDGVTTFNLPDLRGRSLIGTGATPGFPGTVRILGDVGGEELHQLTTGELAAHTHPIIDPGHDHAIYVDGGGVPGTASPAGSNVPGPTITPAAQSTLNPTNVTTDVGGSNQFHNTMHPFAAATCLVYAGV
jgi:microcystin-dependent protein